MSESSMNESLLRSLNLEANSLIGEQTERLRQSKNLLHDAVDIIHTQQSTIATLNEVINIKDETILCQLQTIETLKAIARRQQQILNG